MSSSKYRSFPLGLNVSSKIQGDEGDIFLTMYLYQYMPDEIMY